MNVSPALMAFDSSGDQPWIAEDGDDMCIVVVPYSDSWLTAFRLRKGNAMEQWRVVEFGAALSGVDANLTGNSLRDLPLGELVATARRTARGALRPEASKWRSPSDVALSAFRSHARGRGRPDRDFAELALEYVLLVDGGDRTPAKTLADRFGNTQSAWVNRILQARRRGLLTPVGRGEAGGSLTPKAEELLFPEAGEDE